MSNVFFLPLIGLKSGKDVKSGQDTNVRSYVLDVPQEPNGSLSINRLFSVVGTGTKPAFRRLGQRVAGIYRRSVMIASGRYAMLDDGKGFSLVPWKPVIEQRLGQQLAATVRGAGVSWEVGRQRSISMG